MQLLYRGEYGVELAVFIPYVYFLKQSRAQFIVSTYVGMAPYYFFLSPTEITFRNEQRTYIQPNMRLFLPEALRNEETIFTQGGKPDEYAAPPYHEYFTKVPISFSKPYVIIQNKYNHEWGMAPKNFFDVDDVRKMLHILTPHYRVFYFRTNSFRGGGYSADHNEAESVPMNEKDILRKEFPNEFVPIEDMLGNMSPPIDFNTLKCFMLTNACATIGTISGFLFFDGYFPCQHIIYRRDAPLRFNLEFYQNQHNIACPTPRPIRLATNKEELETAVHELLVNSQ